MPRKHDQRPEPGGEDEYTELVLVVHANNLAEAELFKAELEAHGIATVLEQEGAGVAGIPDVGAGVPVLVPEEQADQAAELIAELESRKTEGAALAKQNEPEEREDLEGLEELDEDLEDVDEDLDEDPEEDEDWEEEDEDWEDEDEDWEDDDEEPGDED
jgi:hypothetical protein